MKLVSSNSSCHRETSLVTDDSEVLDDKFEQMCEAEYPIDDDHDYDMWSIEHGY